MILTRSTSLVTVSLLCLVAMPASGAMGATKKKKVKAPARPTVSSVAPLTLGVGDMLTIRGKNFVIGKKRNTVMFKRDGKPAVAVKAAESSSTTMKVVVPSSLATYFVTTDGAPQPTKFRLRILAKRFGLNFTSPAMSPLIGPGNAPGAKSPVAPVTNLTPAPAAPVVAPALPPDCDGDGILDGVDTDDDNDLLTDALEATLKLDPCLADTDGDGVEDGYEWMSAVDLNRTQGASLPYPGKRPYPNPLDAGDASTDYDGDGLGMDQEQLMWKTFGPRSLVLSYSAGLKRSTNSPNPVPSTCVAVPGVDCNDDFRDVDGDNLGNWDEFNGRMTPEWWEAKYPTEVPYPQHYLGTSAVDADTDGDGLNDGDDDIDHDDTVAGPGTQWTNRQELDRDISGIRVHPFNPCLPDPVNSPTCSEHPPFTNAYPPFDTGWTIVPIPWP